MKRPDIKSESFEVQELNKYIDHLEATPSNDKGGESLEAFNLQIKTAKHYLNAMAKGEPTGMIEDCNNIKMHLDCIDRIVRDLVSPSEPIGYLIDGRRYVSKEDMKSKTMHEGVKVIKLYAEPVLSKNLDMLNWAKSELSHAKEPKVGKQHSPYRDNHIKFLNKIIDWLE